MSTQIINYSTCKTCNAPLGIHSINNESCKIIPGYSILFGQNKGYHLLKKCCPTNASKQLLKIFQFIGEYGNYNKYTSKEREININCCPVCLETFEENTGKEFYYIELPCQHIICSNCIFNINNKCPSCKENIIDNINPLQFMTTSTNPPNSINSVKVNRTSSIGCLMRSSTQEVYDPSSPEDINNNFYSLHKFDKLRFLFWNKQDPSTATINNVCLNTTIESVSPLLVNVITDKTITFNDVVCYIYINNNIDGIVKYNKQEYINTDLNLKLSHSGDKEK